MRMDCTITNWKSWDRFLDRCVQDFRKEFGASPDLLVANKVTFRRLNVAANKAHVRGKNGKAPESYVELKGFAGKDYSLHFAEEDDVLDNGFALIKIQQG
jgi:hypothetical protein